MSDGEDGTECLVCLVDFLDSTRLDGGAIHQCAEGHLLCATCFEAVGGAAALCSVCDVPIGVIRNRALEKLRNMKARERRLAGDAAAPGNATGVRTVPSGSIGDGAANGDGAAGDAPVGSSTGIPAEGRAGAAQEGAGKGAAAAAGRPASILSKFTFTSPSPGLFQFGSAGASSGSDAGAAGAQQRNGESFPAASAGLQGSAGAGSPSSSSSWIHVKDGDSMPASCGESPASASPPSPRAAAEASGRTATSPDADINKTVKTMMSKVPVAGPDSGPKRFAFAKKLRTLFGISDSVRCRTLLRRIKELAGKEVPTIRLVEERARGGSGRKVVLPNAVLPGGKHSFGALKVDKQCMKLLQDGLKYGLRSSHQCRHKCVCDDDCSLHLRDGMLSGAMELKMVGWTASALRANWSRDEMIPLEEARRDKKDVIKVLKDMGVDGIQFDVEHPLIIPMFTVEKNEDGWLGGFLFVDNFVSVDYVATNLKGGLGNLQRHLMKNENPVAENLRAHKKSSTNMQEKKNVPTQYTGALVGTFVKVKRSIPIATKWVFCDGFARVSVSQDIQIKDVAADDPLHPILFLDAAAWGRRCRLQNGRASDAGGEDLFADPSCSDECEHDEFAFGRKRRKTLREVIGGGRAGPCS